MMSWQARVLEGFLRVNNMFSGNRQKLDVARERAEVEAMTAMFKPVAETRHEPVSVGGLPAEWVIPGQAAPGRAILFLHGGSFNSGSIKSHRTLAGNVAIACKARALLLDYRLAPEHPFPAGVEDAAAAFAWLTAQGFAPRQIVVAGDSAGGTLALNLLLRLRDEGQAMPAGGVCLSPAPDLTFSGESWKFNARKDVMLVEEKERAAMGIYLKDVDARSPLASPLFADLRGLPPLLLQVGSYELLLSDVERFAEKAKAAGVDATLDVWQGMQHEWQFAAKYLPEGRRALARIGEFVEAIFARAA